MRMPQAASLTMVVLAGFTPAFGMYIAYEGEVFPEDDGWTVTGNPQDPSRYTRSISDGIFTIHATADGVATVYYERERPLTSNNIFYEWRSRTSNNDGASLISLSLMRPSFWSQIILGWRADQATAYFYQEAGIVSAWTQVSLTPGEFHTFRVESNGALHTLYIDGVERLSDELQAPTGLNGLVKFGFLKTHDNIPTESDWDYIRVGEVPEPCTLLLIGLGVACAKRPRRPRQKNGPGSFVDGWIVMVETGRSDAETSARKPSGIRKESAR